jgi:hypothetical protein
VLAGEKDEVELVAHREGPVVERDLLERCEARQTGVVEEHVDAAVLGRGAVDPDAYGILVREIDRRGGRHRPPCAADELQGLLCTGDVEVAPDDGRAFMGEERRRRASDPTAGTGHEGDLGLEASHRRQTRSATRRSRP